MCNKQIYPPSQLTVNTSGISEERSSILLAPMLFKKFVIKHYFPHPTAILLELKGDTRTHQDS